MINELKATKNVERDIIVSYKNGCLW